MRGRGRVLVGIRSGRRGGIGGRCYVCVHVYANVCQCMRMYVDMCERGSGSERAGAAFGIHGKLLRITGIIRMGL